VEPLDPKLVEKFLGGRGLAAYIYYEEVGPEVNPISPENKLIFCVGPLTGAPAPATTKTSLATKSPETGRYLCTNAGGWFGPHLKFCGYDAVIIEGRAPRPVYILIEDCNISFHDAADLLGKTTTEVNQILSGRHRCRPEQVVSAGPAAERGVVFANLQAGDRSFGRGGAGLVLISKNVKAILAKGAGSVGVAYPKEFTASAAEATRVARETRTGHTKYGTAQYVGAMNELGAFPVRNFQTTTLPEYKKITAEAIKERFFTHNKGCYRCPVACAQYCYVKDGKFLGAKSDPEYETIGAFGGMCAVTDLAAIVTANMLCDEYGLDTMSTGALIALAMELFERGVITEKDTGGIILRFGNAEALVEMVTAIAQRQHVGNLLAKGMRGIAEAYPEYQDIMMHVKWLPLAAYDPRAFYGNALTNGTSSRGACHNVGGWSIRAELLTKEYDRFAVEGKGLLIKKLQDTRAYIDSLGICTVVRGGYGFTEEPEGRILEYLTGLELTSQLTTIGERIYTLERLILVREGVTGRDDMLPGRLMREPLPDGPAKGHVMDQAKYTGLLNDYYRARGWDEEGRPTGETLAKLDLVNYV